MARTATQQLVAAPTCLAARSRPADQTMRSLSLEASYPKSVCCLQRHTSRSVHPICIAISAKPDAAGTPSAVDHLSAGATYINSMSQLRQRTEAHRCLRGNACLKPYQSGHNDVNTAAAAMKHVVNAPTRLPASLACWHKAGVDLAAAQQLVNRVQLRDCSATIQGISIVITHDDKRGACSAACNTVLCTSESRCWMVALTGSASAAKAHHCRNCSLQDGLGLLTSVPSAVSSVVCQRSCSGSCHIEIYVTPGSPGASPPSTPVSSYRYAPASGPLQPM
jgi:hypothetical protein